MLNRVVLTGRLTRDPELRYTQSGIAVLRFTIAVDRQFRNRQTGERDTDFISCVIWRKPAEAFANFTHKGALVGIDGRLSTSNYENQQGQRVYRTEVDVDNFALLESRSSRNNQQAASTSGERYGNGYQGQAFGSSPYGNSGGAGAFGDISQTTFEGKGASPNGFDSAQQGAIFAQDPDQISVGDLPFAGPNGGVRSADQSSSEGISIDDATAMKNGENVGSGASSADSADNDQNQIPSSDDLPF